MSKVTLLIGGARSGKSHLAQEMGLKSGAKVLFVATAEAGDEEMRRRIAAHRQARPADWRTLEAHTNLGRRITENIGDAGIVIIDCLTLLVSNILMDVEEAAAESAVTAEITRLVDCFDGVKADFIIVTNEVGLGLVPDNHLGRLYRDLLGKANQMLAARADEAYLMVAGIPVRIKPGNAH